VSFWSKPDFSVKRFLEMYWRMNFIGGLLAMATGTPFLLYYIMALHTIHFTLIWVALRVTSLFVTNQGGVQKIAGLCVYFVLIGYCFEPGYSVWQKTAGAALKQVVGAEQADDFYNRLLWDRWASFYGMIFAALYPSFLDRMKSGLHYRFLCIAAVFATTAVFIAGWSVSGGRPAAYMQIHPYIGTLPIYAYVLLRNAAPALVSRVSVPLEWVGEMSLELYLLQFHLLMNRQANGLLVAIPNTYYSLSNTFAVASLYSYFASLCSKIGGRLKNYVFKLSGFGVACVMVAVMVFGASGFLAQQNRNYLLVGGVTNCIFICVASKACGSSRQGSGAGKASKAADAALAPDHVISAHGFMALTTVVFVVLSTFQFVDIPAVPAMLPAVPAPATTPVDISGAPAAGGGGGGDQTAVSGQRLLLMLGDSVTRYAAEDYCPVGEFSSYEQWGNGMKFDEGSYEKLIINAAPHWRILEPGICRTKSTVYIALFSGFATNPYGPW